MKIKKQEWSKTRMVKNKNGQKQEASKRKSIKPYIYKCYITYIHTNHERNFDFIFVWIVSFFFSLEYWCLFYNIISTGRIIEFVSI